MCELSVDYCRMQVDDSIEGSESGLTQVTLTLDVDMRESGECVGDVSAMTDTSIACRRRSSSRHDLPLLTGVWPSYD